MGGCGQRGHCAALVRFSVRLLRPGDLCHRSQAGESAKAEGLGGF